ncbi:hypothetical protein ACP26L_36300 (plasmid) [Paenibacillus sp. S-38]|uniref:hypothetical protein n=1 Tax=Paenibacillus sp. S-38 TaxID=3416710 RepID=UPI003CFB277D
MNKFLTNLYDVIAARGAKASLQDVITGVVQTESDLPVIGVEDKFYAVRADSTNSGKPMLYMFTSGQYVKVGGGGGAADPAMEGRVTRIENASQTIARNFVEDFIKQGLVDVALTDATVGTGYVRTDKLASFTEDYSTSGQFDPANSAGVSLDTNLRRMTLASGMASGVALSTDLVTSGTDFATIDAQIDLPSSMAFSQHDMIHSSSSSHLLPNVIVDRSNRTWYFTAIDNVGLRIKVLRRDGTTDFETTISVAVQTAFNSVNVYANRSIGLAVDLNNRVWVAFPQYANTNGAWAYLGLNSDGTIYKPSTLITTNTNSMNIQYMLSITNGVVDRNGRVWFYYAADTTTRNILLVLNPDGTIYSSTGSSNLPASSLYATTLIYDEARSQVVLIYAYNNAIYYSAWNLDVTIKKATTSIYTAAVWPKPFFDGAGSKLYILAFSTTTTGQLRFGALNLATWAVDTMLDIPSIVSPTSSFPTYTCRLTSGIMDGNVLRLAYPVGSGAASGVSLRYVSISLTGTVVDVDTEVAGYDGQWKERPAMYRDADGAIKLLYASYTNVTGSTNPPGKSMRATNMNTPSSVSFFLSNDGGVTYIPASLGVQANFPKTGNKVRVRMELKSPNTSVTPVVRGYTVIEGNNTTNSEITRTFISSSIPAVTPVSKAMLLVDQELNGGSIMYYLSNDGGRTWAEVTPGKELVFPDYIGSDLRVKAVLHYPLTASLSPYLRGYSITSYNLVTSADINTVNINLMKTNFKIDSQMNAMRNSMKNMMVDVFSDETGIDKSKSTHTYDTVGRSVSSGVVYSLPESTTFTPVSVVLTVDATVPTDGNITYEVSRNGGNTWTTIYPETLLNISKQTTGQQLVIRANITGTAVLRAWALAWA